MLVPFATCTAGACAETLRGLALPRLRKLLRLLVPEGTDLGDAASLSAPHERVLARSHGLPATDGLVPLAALQARQSGRGDTGEGWAWITPAHWHVAQDHVRMTHPQELQLDEEASRALLAAMRPYFAEDGITLEYDAPLRWLARAAIFRGLPSASLDRVIGRVIHPAWMPSGEGGRTVRRLQQEMQMLMYTLPLNEERERAGLLPVNSFWASGTGALPAGAAPPADRVQVTPRLRDAALLGDWAGWAAAWQELDAQEGAALLDAAAAGGTVRLTLCGETGARTWSSAGAGAWRRVGAWFGAAPVASYVEGL